jgi:hypothetical protein
MAKIIGIDDAQRSLDELALLRRRTCDQVWEILNAAAQEVEEINAQHYSCRAISESELRDILYTAEILVERLTLPTERFIRDDATPAEPFDGDYPDWLRGDR